MEVIAGHFFNIFIPFVYNSYITYVPILKIKYFTSFFQKNTVKTKTLLSIIPYVFICYFNFSYDTLG